MYLRICNGADESIGKESTKWTSSSQSSTGAKEKTCAKSSSDLIDEKHIGQSIRVHGARFDNHMVTCWAPHTEEINSQQSYKCKFSGQDETLRRARKIDGARRTSGHGAASVYAGRGQDRLRQSDIAHRRRLPRRLGTQANGPFYTQLLTSSMGEGITTETLLKGDFVTIRTCVFVFQRHRAVIELL